MNLNKWIWYILFMLLIKIKFFYLDKVLGVVIRVGIDIWGFFLYNNIKLFCLIYCIYD